MSGAARPGRTSSWVGALAYRSNSRFRRHCPATVAHCELSICDPEDEPRARQDSCEDVAISGKPEAPDRLLSPAEAAAVFAVDPKTVTRWAEAGRLHSVRTVGGHRRYLRSDVLALRDALLEHAALTSTSTATHSLEPAPASWEPPEGGHDHPNLDASPRSNRRVAAPTANDSAAAVVAEAVAIAMEAEAQAAAEAVLVIATAAAAAAEMASEAAARARGARTFAAAQAAQLVATGAEQSAAVTRSRAEAAAIQVAQAATRAASVVIAAGIPGQEAHASVVALLVAATVEAAADTTARETALAAVAVANTVSAAAAEVAQTVSTADADAEAEVAATAQALEGTIAITADLVAAETRARAEGIAIAAREAATAVLYP